MFDPTEDEQPGQIGQYRIVKPLGEGGMAVVYLAEQDEPVRRSVALKILKAGMDSKQVVVRFESERQALAVLDHPNIASIYDGGVAENGRPYFVMEYVDGLPITEFCDAHRLDNAARLKLFAQVCRAVQHAHLKGLIHRDIKPSNILVSLVDGEPQPKIIDFGIAKATEISLTEETMQTRLGQFLGTPQYMSPEQTGLFEGDVDTRADIYSLGVVLYELLVGSVPLDLTAVRDIALPAVIRDKVPPRPSNRFTSLGDDRTDVANTRGSSVHDMTRELRGDLDWIVMKAIEKDRTRRYETANALAIDCERYLNREPVQARPPSTGYLLGRFVQRNRVVVAAASIAVIAILAGAIVATIGFLRATDAEQLARQEAETATQVSDFLIGLFEVSDPTEARGDSITAREVLDRGVESIGEDLADQPEVRATLQTTMGGVYRNLGSLESAEQLHRSALETRTEILGADHPDTLTTANWLGVALMELSRFDDAESVYVDTLERRKRVLGDRHPDTLKSIHNLAGLLRFTGRLDEAETLYLEALAGEREVLGNEDDLTLLTLTNIGALYQQMGRLDESLALLEELVATRIRVNGADHRQTLYARDTLAGLYLQLERLDDAEALYVPLVEDSRRVLGVDNLQTLWTMDGLAYVYGEQGRIDEAESLQREVIERLRTKFGIEHIQTLSSMINLSELYRANDRFSEAEQLLLEALAVQRRSYPDSNGTAVSSHNLAALYNTTGRPADAIPLFQDAEQIWEPMFPPEHLYRMENARLWAEALRKTGDAEGAARLEARLEEFGGGGSDADAQDY